MYLNLLTEEEKKAFIELAHIIAKANGIVDESEAAMLAQYEREMGIGYALQELQLEDILPVIHSERSKRIIFIESLAMAFADGIYHDEQKEIIIRLKKAFNITPEVYVEWKNWIISINEMYAKGFNFINHGIQDELSV